MEENFENMTQEYVYCFSCMHFRMDDDDMPYCYHSNECSIVNCEDSAPLYIKPCYTQTKERWRKLKPCLVARLRAINNLSVAFHECGPYDDREEVEFAMKVERLSDIAELWE